MTWVWRRWTRAVMGGSLCVRDRQSPAEEPHINENNLGIFDLVLGC